MVASTRINKEPAKAESVMKYISLLKEQLPTDQALDGFVVYFRRRGAFTPSQVLFIFKMLRKHRIHYDASEFKITIRKDREQEQLRAMSDADISLIWMALSRDQQEWSRRHRQWSGRTS